MWLIYILISKNGEKNSTKNHNFFHVFGSPFMKNKIHHVPKFCHQEKKNKKTKKQKNASEFGWCVKERV